MFFSANTQFTIGQFAKLHEINKKTLMWYDEIGLLKPAVVKENGYRYYTYQQSSLLETILLLRELNISIHEIQTFIQNRSASSLEQLLTEKISELDHTIAHLTAIQKILSSRRQDMVTLQYLDLDRISIVPKKEPHYLITVDTSRQTPFEREIEKVIAETKKHQLQRLHNATYGAMLSVENIYHGRFDGYTSLFIEIPNAIYKKEIHIQPSGNYLTAYCKGSWDKLPSCYQKMLAFAKKNQFTLSGFAYEKGINEIVIDTLEDYITQIEIPIKAP